VTRACDDGVVPVLARARYALLDRALARGLLSDPLLRAGSRVSARARIRRESRGGVEAQAQRLAALLATMRSGPIAESPARANEQHYELPAEFFELFLGPRLKYSCGYWEDGASDLAASEEAMLALCCERAGLRDGMSVLDLGCGWGSLALWICERHPGASVVAVSNSATQRAWIEALAARRGFGERLRVLTADVNEFAPQQRFDRVLSIEMFEHMRNWEALLARIAGWLEPDGKLFVHVFSHSRLAYEFRGTWAAERFFAAGRMPSHELLLHFQKDLLVRESWAVAGSHYARTLRAWLERLDAHADRAGRLLGEALGADESARALAGWRLFLISTAEMWGYREGDEWMVSHHLLEPR
jgi:cyclopropane-fatty-acyl-phospholipid synthase